MTDAASLPPEVAIMLPALDAAPRCSDFTREIHLAPQGTALDLAMVVLVETPLPWPKPVFDHDLLAGLTNTFDGAVGQTRILATHPTAPADAPITVTCFWREGPETRAAVLTASDPAELHECLAELHHVGPMRSHFLSERPAPERALVVCTQGSHDICCGAEGTRLATDLELTRPDLAVYRVSHIGGHRFAPTVLTLPDGRMWARSTTDDIEAIVDRRVQPADVADLCRGWWGAATGLAQTAEVAVFATQPWGWDDTERTVQLDGEIATVTADHETFSVRVAVTRRVPTIACHAAGGLPAKLASEFHAEVLR